jgi:hypothetical protein
MSSLDQVHQQAAESPDLHNEAGHAWKHEATPERRISRAGRNQRL